MQEKIREYIKSNGLSFKHVANKSGIKEKRFYHLMEGHARLSIEEYGAICNGLNVEHGYFFDQ